ncbi:MAG TPA: glycosyltransferase family 1 protein, partial [Bacteroidales bacterium]|nr:glycosyltransferase family 1 protein [Bacteroidales bacterium]
ENIIPLTAYPPAKHPYLWYFFFEWGVPYQLRKIKPDLFFSPDGWVPLTKKVKMVNVIHDLNFEHHPEFIAPTPLKYYQKYFHQFAQYPERIVTVSEFSKNDISELYGVDKERIDVVYNGSNMLYRPLTDIEKEQTKGKYSFGYPYFLFVGLVHKRKNLQRILEAFDRFKEQDQEQYKMVVVGELKYMDEETRESIENMKFKDDVIFLGRKPIDELIMITGSATAMVYTSLFEGFGIPIVEAFQAGTPLITSNVTSMPEIAGDAALIVDPYQVQEIANTMIKITKEPELVKELIEKGKKRATLFSWDLTAERVWRSIEKVLYS